MLILLEGFDGVGKTTLSKQLAARLGALVLPTPSPEDVGVLIRERQDLSPYPPAAMAHLYVADQILTETRIPYLLTEDPDRPLIFDRHCMTSGPAYRPAPWNGLWTVLHMSRTFRRPDLGIVLEAPPAVIRQRLAAKDHLCPWTDDQIIAISRRTLSFAQLFCAEVTTLDATLYAETISDLAALEVESRA